MMGYVCFEIEELDQLYYDTSLFLVKLWYADHLFLPHNGREQYKNASNKGE